MLREGKKFIAIKKFINKFSGYPLKVVYEMTGDEITTITAYPLKKEALEVMHEVRYDREVDASYIQMPSKKPDGAVEIAEGVILHTLTKNEIVAIEILVASKKYR